MLQTAAVLVHGVHRADQHDRHENRKDADLAHQRDTPDERQHAADDADERLGFRIPLGKPLEFQGEVRTGERVQHARHPASATETGQGAKPPLRQSPQASPVAGPAGRGFANDSRTTPEKKPLTAGDFMEVIFLGTGTSQGVPLIAHPNEGLDLADKRNHRTRSSVHVVLDGIHVQVDCGPEFRLQCLWNDIRHIDFVILTHGHADHMMGFDDLRRFVEMRGGHAMPVYTTDEGAERLRACYPYAMAEKAISGGYVALKPLLMPPVMTLPNGCTIRSVLLPHGSIETLGLVFEEKSTGRKLVYFNDCKRVTDEALALAMDADVAVLDGLKPDPHPSHMAIEEAVTAAHAMRAKRAFITHMTFLVDQATWEEETPVARAAGLRRPARDGVTGGGRRRGGRC